MEGGTRREYSRVVLQVFPCFTADCVLCHNVGFSSSTKFSLSFSFIEVVLRVTTEENDASMSLENMAIGTYQPVPSTLCTGVHLRKM